MSKPGRVLFCFTLLVSSLSFADEAIHEKVAAGSKTAIRAAKKAGNRVKESLCMEGDLKCGAKKAGNRAMEVKDSVVDGASEVKGKLD